jgi:DNA-binding protein Fis
MSQLILEDLNLEAAERRLCSEALSTAGNITGAAELLGIDRHALRRRIKKLGIEWPPIRVAVATKPTVGQ